MRIAILSLLLTTAAHAGTHEVSIGSASRTLRTSSANAVTEDSLGGGTLAYAHAVPLDLLPGVELWAEGAFAWGGADGTLFQTLTTDIDTLAFTLGARARYELYPRIVASARLDVGTARAALAIRDNAGHTASDHGWGALTAGALGLDLYAIYRSRLTLGLRFELGYIATTSVAMTATPQSDSADTLQLQMTAASLGSLNLSGAVFGVSIVSQF